TLETMGMFHAKHMWSLLTVPQRLQLLKETKSLAKRNPVVAKLRHELKERVNDPEENYWQRAAREEMERAEQEELRAEGEPEVRAACARLGIPYPPELFGLCLRLGLPDPPPKLEEDDDNEQEEGE